MIEETRLRIDEVDRYYRPVTTLATVRRWVFWAVAALSLVVLQSHVLPTEAIQEVARTLFVVGGIAYFVLAQISRFYLVPRAERARRQQLLSDAFGTVLTVEQTQLYYNNEYPPSIQRLGASTMENAFFSKEIAARMLRRDRAVVAGYLLAWLVAFALPHSNVALLAWVTQVAFSTEVVVRWLSLEVFRARSETVYDELHRHFLLGVGDQSEGGVATILDSFVSYEMGKASTSVQLSTSVFKEMNPHLSEAWTRIRQRLRMEPG